VTNTSQIYTEPTPLAVRRARARRGRALVLVVAAAGVVAACLAVVLGGSCRIALAAAALVLLVTAAYCAGAVWFETREYPPLDIEAPPPMAPLPQSPVTEIYDPPPPPNNRLQRTGEG
jgi:hypothetical protein